MEILALFLKGANIFNYFWPMQGIICRKITVSGRVQGVFYRKHAQEKALELQITGTVQNNSDGSVELFACGDEKSINDFIKWCRVGPPLAHVENLASEPTDFSAFEKFYILK